MSEEPQKQSTVIPAILYPVLFMAGAAWGNFTQHRDLSAEQDAMQVQLREELDEVYNHVYLLGKQIGLLHDRLAFEAQMPEDPGPEEDDGPIITAQ